MTNGLLVRAGRMQECATIRPQGRAMKFDMTFKAGALSAALGVPRVAIGGITPDNMGPLVAAGAELVAVIGGVFEAADPVAAAQAYRSGFDRA